MPPATVQAREQDAAAYDGIARLYDRYWRNVSLKLMPALDTLVFQSLSRGAAVLDLCCGTGIIAAAMCRRGFKVTGLDGSHDMIGIARGNAPDARFVVADARTFELGTRFDAVVSTGDSMNHLLTREDLAAAFGRVYEALEAGGRFVFDMNMAEAFETQWRKSSTVAAPDHLLYVRGQYERSSKVGTTEVTIFSGSGHWTRLDLRLYQRCYGLRDVRMMLRAAGFDPVTSHPARSFGIRGRLGIGRTFFEARKP